MDHAPEGWTTWTAREEISPRFYVDAEGGKLGPALVIAGNKNPAAHGSWQKRIPVTPGSCYRFTTWYQTRNVPHALRSVSAHIDWRDDQDRRACPPDYAFETSPASGWTRLDHVAQAPEGAKEAVLNLSFGWSAEGLVRWRTAEIVEEHTFSERTIRAATVHHRPSGTSSPQESVDQFSRLIRAGSRLRPDLICLPEGITASSAISESAGPGATEVKLSLSSSGASFFGPVRFVGKASQPKAIERFVRTPARLGVAFEMFWLTAVAKP